MPDLQTIINFGGYLIAAGLAVFSLFNSQWKQRQKDVDSTATNLINNLKTTVDIQEKTIAKIQKENSEHIVKRDAELKDLSAKLHELSGRNKVLEDLFKGRDPAMKAFFEDAPVILQIAKENNKLATDNSKAIHDLTEQIMGLVEVLKIKNS